MVWAEDSDSDQYLIKAALQGTPHESSISFIENGAEALKQIAEERPRGVVLDLNMPGMDGITTLKRIREQHGDLPVIIFSTANDPEQVRACRRLGILAYAVKPTDYEAFCGVVHASWPNSTHAPVSMRHLWSVSEHRQGGTGRHDAPYGCMG